MNLTLLTYNMQVCLLVGWFVFTFVNHEGLNRYKLYSNAFSAKHIKTENKLLIIFSFLSFFMNYVFII